MHKGSVYKYARLFYLPCWLFWPGYAPDRGKFRVGNPNSNLGWLDLEALGTLISSQVEPVESLLASRYLFEGINGSDLIQVTLESRADRRGDVGVVDFRRRYSGVDIAMVRTILYPQGRSCHLSTEEEVAWTVWDTVTGYGGPLPDLFFDPLAWDETP